MRQPARWSLTGILIIAAVVSGCAPAPATRTTPIPTAAPTTRPLATAPAVAPVAATATVAAPTAAPSVPPPATRTPGVEPQPFFGPAWGERTVYEPALIAAERSVLRKFEGASEYRISMTIASDYLSVTGRQQVRYTNLEDAPLDQLYFRLFPNAMGGEMTVASVIVNGQASGGKLVYEETALSVPLDPPLRPGSRVIVELGYELTVPEDLETGYGLLSYSGDILALDSPYLMIPVFDDEGWNVETPPRNADTSYNDMSFYLVRVTAPRALTIAAAGVEIDRAQHNGEQIVTYAAAPVRDFYLAASERYEVVTQQAGDVTVRSFALPEQADAAQAALSHAAGALESFGRRFGRYPYTELDLAATPMLALGIEYPGITGITTELYKEGDMGGRPVSAVIQSTVAHEVAHQWFYNLIGSDQVDEPWLDEAMAQYATSLYLSDIGGEPAEEAYRDTWFGRWDRVDRSAKSIGLPAQAYDGGEYSAIVYGRGPLFVHELRTVMGEGQFEQFLWEYSQQFRWGIATTEDFKEVAEAACGCDLTDLFDVWVYE
jgi:aminopeptidase N